MGVIRFAQMVAHSDGLKAWHPGNAQRTTRIQSIRKRVMLVGIGTSRRVNAITHIRFTASRHPQRMLTIVTMKSMSCDTQALADQLIGETEGKTTMYATRQNS